MRREFYDRIQDRILPKTAEGSFSMKDLIKIREISAKYDISARTLRYCEDMGLLTSKRSNDYAYRLYDSCNIRRLEQILILRRLNISIKDIQRIFRTARPISSGLRRTERPSGSGRWKTG